MKSRKELLAALVVNEHPDRIPDLLEKLAEYGWDSDEKFVRLESGHITAILRRYLSGDLSQEEVEEWALAFEAREDVEWGGEDEGHAAKDAVYILANPALEGALTTERAQNLVDSLGSE